MYFYMYLFIGDDHKVYGQNLKASRIMSNAWDLFHHLGREDVSKGKILTRKKACNRKLIGARYYLKGFEETLGPLNRSSSNHEYQSPRDFLGHGTHTASTAVGSVVRNASFLGLGRGTARGGAPRARLAVYKVCWGRGLEGKCSEADILAAFDEALHDGVHVISASFGEPPPLRPFFASSADIGSFHGMQRGISVVFSAGNDDSSQPSVVQNVAPWVCEMEMWNGKLATGKVVICFSTRGTVKGEAAAALRKANASALIFAQPITLQIPELLDFIPIVLVDITQGTQLQYYLAQFPKYPDITAPGTSILAAWPTSTPPTLYPADGRSVNWNFQSGTSMSCPHVTGVVALIKSAHPSWSPAAIRSALMTTALTRDTTHDSILAGGSMKVSDPFDVGSGHINPRKAMDPGLVYDLKPNDYILFLCNIGYTQEKLQKIVLSLPGTKTISCPPTNTDINYPSITVSNLQSSVMTIKRTVKNVGEKRNVVYFAATLWSLMGLSEEDAKRSMLYSYKHSFSGFSAKINASQAASLANKITLVAEMEGVISVFEGRTLKLHTTRSWDFLGLTLNGIDEDHDQLTPLQLAYGNDIIVGVLDTGVWPESESFQDNEQCLGPIPSSWKGRCVQGENFDPKKACNRKLIGARYYLKGFEETLGPLNRSSSNHEYQSPRDFLGHGTHTASTAVGSVVRNASFLGLGRGTARGGAPRARLAVYKVCWGRGLEGKCSEADILAAFDEALHDGVHVISASFGEPPPLRPFFASSADIGSFHGMQRGISVVFSAGNDDSSQPSVVQNVAPWVCEMEMWNGKLATGKVVICFSTRGTVKGEAAAALRKANASALIFAQPITLQIPELLDFIPIVLVDITQGTQLQYYLAQFPKYPDITAPGTSILAAWPTSTPPTLYPADGRSVSWNFQSGTSMSCPHVTGVVALIKSAHPSWSPAAIRSALMTTALTRDTTHDSILAGGSMKVSDPFDVGSGHINPRKAMDPGLVYDLKPNDYILFLCNIGYTQEKLQKIVLSLPGTKTISCPPTNTDINYPSITVSNLQSSVMTIKRTVKNVGEKRNVVYFCSNIVEPDGIEVVVWPRVLFFSFYKEELSFYVTLKPVKASQGRYDFGEIVWSDGFHHHVRTPLIVLLNNTSITMDHHHHTSF
ncbi:hypothetical protein LWI29_030979 [Acer saccharum]|uniref:Subtilisin-like protease SBT3.18 n=1 Tax=Acer saccharum TaxID=4024 RepID=A0AA39W114_ACESA|nr:hypothetical protein LWI29_030979 [Acer saccharum]